MPSTATIWSPTCTSPSAAACPPALTSTILFVLSMSRPRPRGPRRSAYTRRTMRRPRDLEESLRTTTGARARARLSTRRACTSAPPPAACRCVCRPPMTSASHAQHAVCVTGLERSFRGISGNLIAALSGLYGGLDGVAWFGVRPTQDAWATVHARLPPFRAERTQQQCVRGKSIMWYSAYSRSAQAFWSTYRIWTLTLCDQPARSSEKCHGQPTSRP